MSSGTAIGIDLGTTFSVISTVNPDGHVEVIPNADGHQTTPSVIFFDGDSIIVGREAAKAGLLEPENVADCFKREMGQAQFSKRINGRFHRPEMLSAIILRKLLKDAERALGSIDEAVITVPAYFGDTCRKAAQDAAAIAGLKKCALINEPTAAALSYGYQVGHSPDEERTVLVYDLGGGTFDVTMMRISGGCNFTTLATDGEVMLGGKDWDGRLVDYVAGEFMRQAGSDPREDDMSYQDLIMRVEECKLSLSRRPSATVPVMHAGKRLGIRVMRDRFEELTADLLVRTQTAVELLIGDAGLTWDQVDDVLLVGGASRMAMIPEMLGKVTGKTISRSIEEDLAVAKGAAIYAASLMAKRVVKGAPKQLNDHAVERLSAIRHRNVNSHSLGIVARNRHTKELENAILTPKNSALPCKHSRVFGLSRAGQTRIRVTILEGEAPNPKGCITVGKCYIDNLPKGLPKGSPVEVAFTYSEDGRVHVSACATDVGRQASAEIRRPEGLDTDGLREQTQELSAISIV
jgi:molecular chaperone DnaK